MATTMQGMKVDATEDMSEDGLTNLERKVLFRLLCVGEVTAPNDGNEGYEIGQKLKFAPGNAGEHRQPMYSLVEKGFVERHVRAKTTSRYAEPSSHHEVAERDEDHVYRPVNKTGYRRPVMAYLFVYGGVLTWDENRIDGVCRKSTIVEAMGDTMYGEQDLLADAEFVKRMRGVELHEQPDVPVRWRGSHGDMQALRVTRVTLRLDRA